jgi:1,4-dihydroxy-6-naphthoate synthase
MNDPNRPLLRLGHSPDPDDAFMWWPLDPPDGRARLDTGRFRFKSVLDDIESLNRRSLTGELEITALSCASYPAARQKYALTACGSSMGERYGPKIVSSRPLSVSDLTEDSAVIAIPGRGTSAFLAMRLMLAGRPLRWHEVPFDQIIDRVASGEFDAGLVIHEGQLTFEQAGLRQVADLGQWWHERHGLPLPLGVNAIRRDLERIHGPGTLREVAAILLASVQYAMAHRHEAMEHALAFGRGIDHQQADRFVSMYVNRWTLDFGPIGRRAVEVFLAEAVMAGLAPDPGPVDFIEAGDPQPTEAGE